MCPSDRPAGCANRVRQPRVSLKRLTRLTRLTQRAESPPFNPPVSRKGRSTDAPPSACATGCGSAQTPQDMPGRLRRREGELYASIRDAESAGMDYAETIRPLVVELRDCIAKRNAQEAAGDAFTSPALSVSAETLKRPKGRK